MSVDFEFKNTSLTSFPNNFQALESVGRDFNDTNIFERKQSIDDRMSIDVSGFRMPFIGATMIHTEGLNLIQEYLNTL